MANINEPIRDPFNPDVEHDSYSAKWFAGKALQAIALGGLGLAAYKMKGPTGKVVQKYLDRQRNSRLAKDMLKIQDSQDYLLGEDFSVRPPNFGIPEIDEDILPPELMDDGYPSTDDAKNSLTNIENLEDGILRRSTNDIAFSQGSLPRIEPGPIQPKIGFDQISPTLKDDILWEARTEALIDFLQKNTPIEQDDWEQIEKFRTRGTPDDKAALAAKHRSYAQMYPEYAERYTSLLRTLKRNYDLNRAEYENNSANIGRRLQESEVIRWHNSPPNLDDNASFPLDVQINAKRVIPEKVDIKDIISKGGTITSGSLDKTVKIDPGSLFSKLGQFDYFPLIKKLSGRLEDIKNMSGHDLDLEDLDYEVIAKGRSVRPDYHLRITFQFSGRKPLFVEVPLSQWGRIPGVTEGITHRTDRLYELPNGVRNVYKKVSLDINKDLENTTQQALRKLITALDSRIIDQAKTDPLKAVTQLQRSVNNVIRQAPIAEGLASDAIKALIIQPSFYKKNTSKMMLMQLEDAVATGYNIKRFNSALAGRKDAINVTLDFETISPDVGPQHMALSEDTQLTKAGIVVHDIHNGKVTAKAVDEIVSDHGVDIVKKLGVSQRTADWISQEIPQPKGMSDEDFTDYMKVLRGQGPEEVFDTWSRKAMIPAANRYRTMRGGRHFKNNIEFAEHVGQKILDALDDAKRTGKDIFITTKNGNMFDLHLLKRYAPNAWAKIQKHHRHLIDLQSIAYFRQQGFGGTESLGLNKILMQTMRRIDPRAPVIDIDRKGGLRKALEWFNSQKGYQISSTSQLDYLEKMGITLQEAHSTPAGDAMAEFIMLMDEAHKYKAGDRAYHELDELQRWLTKQKKILGLDETLQEYRALETRYTVFGRVASSALLSQGNIQNELVSLFTPDQLFPFPDNKLSKQWYQLEKGHANVLNERWFDKRYKTDVSRREARRLASVPSIMTQGQLDAHNYLRQVGDDTAAMSHQVFVDTLAVWNPYRGKEGFQSWSSDVWRQRQFHFDKTVPLNPNSYIDDPIIRKEISAIISDANKIARDRMGTLEGDIPASVLEDATRDAMAKRGPLQIGPGSTVLAKGERGYETIKTEFGGQVYDVFSAKDPGGKIRMYAKIKFIASGNDMEGVAVRARSFLSKGIATSDKLLSLGTAMGGPQAVVSADFFEKGYVGAMKTFIASEVNDRFNRVINDPNAPKSEKIKAKAAQKNFMLTMNAELNAEGTLITKSRDIRSKLKHISDPEMRSKAQLFVGGIDLNAETMLGHMREAGMSWTLDDAKRYYAMFGGEKRVRDHVENTIQEAKRSIDDMIDKKTGALQGIGMNERKRLHNDMDVMLRSFLLPNLKKLTQKNYRQATIFGFHKEFAGIADSPYQFGVRGRVGAAIYGLMRGMQADVKDVKLRGDLLKMINIPGTTLSRQALELIQENRLYANERRFFRAAQTVHNFKNALLSSAFTSGAELDLRDLNSLIDRIGGIDLRRIGRSVGDLSELESKATTLLEEAKDSGDVQNLIDNIVDDIKTNDAIEAFRKNEGFVTGSAVSKLVSLAKQKGGAFAYSAKEELGGAFTFNIKEIVNHGLNITEQPDTIDKAMEFFVKLSKRPDSIVESIDRTNYTVKLKKLIFHADMSGQNVFNALNPAGKETVIGLLNNASRKRQDAFLALQKFEEQFQRSKSTGELILDESLLASQALAKKQYMRYLLDGFLLDSESVYKRAFDMAPTGMYSTIAGAEGVFSRAVHLQRIGIKNFDKQIDQKLAKKITRVVDDVVENSVINNIFVTRSFFEKMRVKEGNNLVTVRERLKTIFGSQTKADEIFEEIARGEMRMPALGVGFPTYQNAKDAGLDLTLKVIPDEVAPYLNMNANVMNVFAEMARIQARDFDGDEIALVLKGLRKGQDLMQWSREHRGSLESIMRRTDIQAQMVADDKGIKRLGFGVESFMEGGKVMMMGIDERGRVVHDVLDAHQVPLGDVTSKMVDLATQASIHTPSSLTPKYISNQMDVVAQVAVSKQNIGLFTNVYRKRISQILQAGIVKDPLDKSLLIGNSTIGLGKLAQDIIGLAKHGTGVDDIAKVAKVFISDRSSSFDRERAFDDYFIRSFESVDLPQEKRKQLLQMYKASVKKIKYEEGVEGVHQQLRSLANLDIGRDEANIFDFIISQEELDQIRYTSEFAQTRPTALGRLIEGSKKRLKFEPEINGQVWRKAGKWGAIGAAAYLALNFFRPSQLSNSANPLDAFTDLGVDFNGDYNLLGTPPELQRGIPLDTVDASFSKQAFIKLRSANSSRNKENRGAVIRNMLRDSFSNYDNFMMEFREPQTTAYSNYTSNIGAFGSNTLHRRATLI